MWLWRRISLEGGQYQDIERSTRLDSWLFTTGLMLGPPSEQALVVATCEGLVVMTGCVHPGILSIVHRVISLFPDQAIALVMGGGFHLMSASEEEIGRIVQTFRRHGVKRVAPSHCSGDVARARFHAAYGDDYIAGGADRTILLG